MTTVKEYDKKKLIILRAALIVIGGAVGALALWQYFVYFPDAVSREYQIVITVVSATVFAALLGLSAKAFYRLGASIAESASSFGRRVGARGIAAVVLGFIASGAFAVAVDAVVCKLQDIWAVRLLIDVLAYMVMAAALGYAFSRWLDASYDEGEKQPPQCVGYLISAQCFTDGRALVAVKTLINVKVCDGAFKALCLYGGEEGLPAAKLLDTLITDGSVTAVRSGDGFSDMNEYLETERATARAKRLKLICPTGDGENCLGLDVFASTANGRSGQAAE